MSKVIYSRIDDADALQLEKIAAKEKRTISWLVAQAVKIFVSRKPKGKS